LDSSLGGAVTGCHLGPRPLRACLDRGADSEPGRKMWGGLSVGVSASDHRPAIATERQAGQKLPRSAAMVSAVPPDRPREGRRGVRKPERLTRACPRPCSPGPGEQVRPLPHFATRRVGASPVRLSHSTPPAPPTPGVLGRTVVYAAWFTGEAEVSFGSWPRPRPPPRVWGCRRVRAPFRPCCRRPHRPASSRRPDRPTDPTRAVSSPDRRCR
jgi:hypothetical protein